MLEEFYKTLEEYRVFPNPDDLYEDRLTHCYLITNFEDKNHTWEVRGWNPLKDDVLKVFAVNWTMAAGYCSIDFTEEILKNNKWIIKKGIE